MLAISEVVREWKARGPSRRPRRGAVPAGRVRRRLRAASSTTSTTSRTGGSSASCPTGPGVPWRVHKHTLMDLDQWPYPSKPLVPLGRDGPRAVLRRDLPRLHPGLSVLPGRHDHPPGARALDHHHRRHGRERASGRRASRRSVCCRCRRPTTARSPRSRRVWPTATRAPTSRCRCPPPGSTRSTSRSANEFSRNGRRSGLTFAPEGGSERLRRVINKMVSEEDLIRTVVRRVLARLAPGEALLHVRAARPRPTRTCWRSPTWPER